MLPRLKRFALGGTLSLIGVAAVQGISLRESFRGQQKLDPPSGKLTGIERWREERADEIQTRIKSLEKHCIDLRAKIAEDDRISRLEQRIEEASQGIKVKLAESEKILQIEKRLDGLRSLLTAKLANAKLKLSSASDPHSSLENRHHQKQLHQQQQQGTAASEIASKRRIQLLVLGDSLAAGVGCSDAKASPVLPQVLARALSQKLVADVEWITVGAVGATVTDLRGLLQEISPKLGANKEITRGPKLEVVCVILCGLNDWKHFLERREGGPLSFREDLMILIGDLNGLGVAHVFVPALPAELLGTDPMFSLGVWPLRYFATLLCKLWDHQKFAVAASLGDGRDGDVFVESDGSAGAVAAKSNATSGSFVTCTYIGSPDVDRHYATPGPGNVSPDGVHPSDQGFRWWGRWLAEKIIKRMSQETP